MSLPRTTSGCFCIQLLLKSLDLSAFFDDTLDASAFSYLFDDIMDASAFSYFFDDILDASAFSYF